MTLTITDIPLTLYIHLPWCVRKCPYCDFNSHAIKQPDLPEHDYVQAVLRDLDNDLEKIAGRSLSAIFIGGGTPSLFSGDGIGSLLEGVRTRLSCTNDLEITLEANPGTVEQQRFRDYRLAGVNRISLGIQSFSDKKLQALGRIHSGREAQQAIAAVRDAGFSNFNLDLMFGLPEQDLHEAMKDLEIASSHTPTHISWYKLTLEPNTYFYHHPPSLPEDDDIWHLFDHGQQYLNECGYHQYEISAYSQQGFQCRHNRNYWEFGDYLGIGAGAHSKISFANGQILRFWKQKHPKIYLQAKNTIQEQKMLEPQELAFEFMLNHLRLFEVVDLRLFAQRTGLAIQSIEKILEEASQKGFLHLRHQHIELTDQGRRFTNELLQLFL